MQGLDILLATDLRGGKKKNATFKVICIQAYFCIRERLIPQMSVNKAIDSNKHK